MFWSRFQTAISLLLARVRLLEVMLQKYELVGSRGEPRTPRFIEVRAILATHRVVLMARVQV